MRPLSWQRKLWLAAAALLVVLLAAAVFTLGSLNVPIRPKGGTSILAFFAVIVFIVTALLIFGLILTRTLLRMWAESRSGQLGSRFKTKMVLGAMGVSLLPVVFLFFFSYALVNRTLNLWFPLPLERANKDTQTLLSQLASSEKAALDSACHGARLQYLARYSYSKPPSDRNEALISEALMQGSDAAWILDANGKLVAGRVNLRDEVSHNAAPAIERVPRALPQLARSLPSGIEIWEARSHLFLAGSCGPTVNDPAARFARKLLVGRRLPDGFLNLLADAETQEQAYEVQRQNLRAYKAAILLGLLLITLLLLFSTMWVALFLSKQVTVPIQALAEATQEVAQGNLAHRVHVQAQDELGTLVASFNQMTAQLDEGRRQINDFTRSLQQAVEERERRRKLMETVLENIPTGVLSLDGEGAIARANSAVVQIFGDHARESQTLADLLGEEAAREVQQLMHRSLRMGAASREIEIGAVGRVLRAAVTVSSLGPRRSNPGFVVVIDDLTELLRAQKAAAWQEVAQRIAHEIKNPLTPIQLSAERLLRHLERSPGAPPRMPQSEFERLVGECATLIEREVRALESLVDEFSQFARFPAARLAPADLNAIVAGALEIFRGRLEGIEVSTGLAPSLPAVRADTELLRRVLVNLIDNAAQAMESSAIRRLTIATRAQADGDAVEIEVGDSGHGISPEDKEKLFLPHFSTKERGTGLGLAIASRIVAEHNGTIQVLDNLPAGSRFILRFPAAEIPASSAASGRAGTAK